MWGSQKPVIQNSRFCTRGGKLAMDGQAVEGGWDSMCLTMGHLQQTSKVNPGKSHVHWARTGTIVRLYRRGRDSTRSGANGQGGLVGAWPVMPPLFFTTVLEP